RPRCVSR
ncbi:hypothetical protein BN1708_019699, partial [Verticillium longisporum]